MKNRWWVLGFLVAGVVLAAPAHAAMPSSLAASLSPDLLVLGPGGPAAPADFANLHLFIQYSINEYVLRFGKMPASLDDLKTRGVAFIPFVNPVTNRAMKNECARPSPGDSCFDPAGKRLLVWGLDGKPDANTLPRPLMEQVFAAWAAVTAPAQPYASLGLRSRTDEDFQWLMAAGILWSRLKAVTCEGEATEVKDLRAKAFVFPFDRMTVAGEPLRPHATLDVNAEGDTFLFKVDHGKKGVIVTQFPVPENGLLACPDKFPGIHPPMG